MRVTHSVHLRHHPPVLTVVHRLSVNSSEEGEICGVWTLNRPISWVSTFNFWVLDPLKRFNPPASLEDSWQGASSSSGGGEVAAGGKPVPFRCLSTLGLTKSYRHQEISSALLSPQGGGFGIHVHMVVQQVLLNTVLLNGPSFNRCATFYFPSPLLQLFAFP